MLTIDKIYHAADELCGVVRKTELLYAPTLCPGVELYLKTENLQTTGSFKIRGAYYKILSLSDEACRNGVIACSAGNHAQGVALAATKNNIKSIICLPSSAPKFKINATRAYGAEVVLVDGVYDDAYNRAITLKDEMGYTMIHPFDDEDIIAGQGTVALELISALPDIEVIVAPIGGGGLISGIAYAIKTIKPKIKIYGVEADAAPSMINSIINNRISEIEMSRTIADGIAVKKPGRLTFELCSRYVDDIVTVSDEQIRVAILTLLERCKLLVEGAGAASFAAVMFGKLNLIGKKTVCLITGGNIDLETLTQIIETKEK